jgi:hypothetical protein
MVTFDFDSRRLAEAFRQYIAVNRRDTAELLQRQANALVNTLGKKGPKGLFREALDEKANVQAAIRQAAASGPLKRPKGRSWQAEFAMRLKYAAAIQAAGWLTHRYGRATSIGGIRKLRLIENPQGQVNQRLEGNEMFIEITNRQARAAEFAQASGYLERAIKNREIDMLAYVERKTRERAQQF